MSHITVTCQDVTVSHHMTMSHDECGREYTDHVVVV